MQDSHKREYEKNPMDLPNGLNNVLRLYTHLTVHQSYTLGPVVHLVKKSSSETIAFIDVHIILMTPTGTIRTCQKFLIQYNRRQLLMLLQNCTNEEERQCIQKSLLSCSLTEEQSHSGDEEDDDGIETD
ncbi:ribonuclease p mrp protein subunit hypothetical protein [Limosa lapponica baueri]|uniref:Uncharacterized protein n=1 Tax=Limosa lapponica baueri TaxID=1758121 RepID=A0A2I0TY17_LIMLA|nr:ribonuclease p mrp protein subunit hypothetical protein [Limosa lapponica baueri]